MNIICIGYFDKFSRFFLGVNKHLKTNADVTVKFNIFSIHLSGFLYTLLRFRFSSWLPLKAWFLAKRKKNYYTKILKTSKSYRDIPFNNYIKFHKALNKDISTKSLQLQALAYIDIFESIFKTLQPDVLLSIGDSRLCIEIATALAKTKGIKIYYIEQGPFNTTFFDEKGVNANLSIRTKFTEFNNTYNNQNESIGLNIKNKKYIRSPIYRGLDILLMKFFQSTSIYPPDLKQSDLISFKFKSKPSKIEPQTANRKLVLLTLQVPIDVNMIYHSPHFNSHVEIVKSVYANLPETAYLVVREHPLFIGKYESEMYNFILDNNITINNNTSIESSIESADVVVVNNSTVGIEAILKYKTTIVLGNAFYDNDKICLKLKQKDDLASLMQKALQYCPDENAINQFKYALYNEILLSGSITDKELNASKQIANHLITHH